MTILMIALGALNAVGRYLSRIGLDLASNAYIEAQWYLFSLVFLLGAAAALREDAHVRVDVIYGRLSRRVRNWIDLWGTFVFLIPFCVFAIAVSVPTVIDSWRELEVSPDPGGLPRYPIKTLIPIAFVLLLLQGMAQAVRLFIRIGSSSEDPIDALPSASDGSER